MSDPTVHSYAVSMRKFPRAMIETNVKKESKISKTLDREPDRMVLTQIHIYNLFVYQLFVALGLFVQVLSRQHKLACLRQILNVKLMFLSSSHMPC